MITASPSSLSAQPRDHWRWPAMILAMLTGNVLIVGGTIYFATGTHSNIVEADWYDRAVSWDQTKADRERLGWTQVLSAQPGEAEGTFRITLALTDRAGREIENADVRLRAIHNAHPDKPVTVPMTQILADGHVRYVAVIPVAHLGLWNLRVHTKVGADALDQEQEVTLGPAVE